MQKAVSILFFCFCLATSWVSSGMLGVGMWFWIIIAGGIFVGLSAFIPLLEALGVAVASMLTAISVIAVLLGLVAVFTLGDSSDFGEGVGLLLFLFAMIAISGFLLGSLQKKKNKNNIETNENEGTLDS